jgi:branched-chain amino acid transport system permease protein
MQGSADNPAPAPAAKPRHAASGGMLLLRGIIPLAIGIIVAFLLHILAQRIIGDYFATILLYVGINIILAVSLNMVNGFTGQFSIGHAGFMAVGGYTAAAITYYGSLLLWKDAGFHGGALSWTRDMASLDVAAWAAGDTLFVIACLVGGIVAALIGLVVGLPSLRLRGDYLAIVTLGFGEIVRVLLQQTSDTIFDPEEVAAASYTTLATSLGGSLGFTGVPYYTTLFWVFAFAALTLIVAHRLKHSTHGRAFLSIRENELASEVMGVPTTRYKVAAFVISSFFAGVAGALFAHQVGTSLNASELGFMKSFDVIIMVVLGGMGSISGAVLAAAIVTILPEVLRQPPHLWGPGLALIATILIIRQRRGVRLALIIAAAVAAWEVIKALAQWQEIKLSDYRMVIYSLSLIVMMLFRPQGLFGIHEAWELPIFHRFKRSKS